MAQAGNPDLHTSAADSGLPDLEAGRTITYRRMSSHGAACGIEVCISRVSVVLLHSLPGLFLRGCAPSLHLHLSLSLAVPFFSEAWTPTEPDDDEDFGGVPTPTLESLAAAKAIAEAWARSGGHALSDCWVLGPIVC